MPQMPDPLTAVILSFRKNRVNNRLLFGTPYDTIRRGWHRHFALFLPGSVFGYERWRANHYGTQDWRLIVAKAVQPGALTHCPGIRPGANIWLDARGATRVRRAFTCLDTLKNQHASLEIVPEHLWRDIHNRLLSGETDARILDAIMSPVLC